MNERTSEQNERTIWILLRYERMLPYPGTCYEQFPVTIPVSLEKKYADAIVSKVRDFMIGYVKENNRASDICHTTNDRSVKDIMGFWRDLLNNTVE